MTQLAPPRLAPSALLPRLTRLARLSWFGVLLCPFLLALTYGLILRTYGFGQLVAHAGEICMFFTVLGTALSGSASGLLTVVSGILALSWAYWGFGPSWGTLSHLQAGELALCGILAPGTAVLIGRLRIRAEKLSEARSAQAYAERESRRNAFLAEASRILDSSLEYETALKSLPDLAVPFIAEWCAVDVLDPDGSIRRVAACHSDPSQKDLLLHLHRNSPIRLESEYPIALALRTGKPQLGAKAEVDTLLKTGASPELMERLRRFRAQAFMVAPLIARDRTLGTITFGTCKEGRRFRAEDLAFAQDLALRAATAVDNARLFGELQRSNSLFQSTLESTTDGILVTDLAGNLLMLNNRFRQIWGLKRNPLHQLTGASAWSLLARQLDGQELAKVRHDKILSNPEGESFDMLVTRDGRYFEVCSVPQRIQKAAVGRVWSFRDITDRQQAEEEKKKAEQARIQLLETERELRQQAQAAQLRASFLAEVSGSLAGSLDYRTILERVAELSVPRLADWCFVEMIGTRPDEGEEEPIQPASVARGRGIQGDGAKKLEKLWPRALQNGSRMAALRNSGKPLLFSVFSAHEALGNQLEESALGEIEGIGIRSLMIVPMIARGKIMGTLTFASSEPSRRYSPTDLALAEDLAHRAALAVDNACLFFKAKNAVAARDEFLSIASHELKTPLTSLHLLLQLLTKVGQTGGFMSEMIAKAERQSMRMSRLIDELLDLSRASSGRLNLDVSSVDLDQMVREITSHFSDDLKMARCPVKIQCNGEVRGAWDPMRIEQVITNLLSNAMKYGRGKPIEILLEANSGWARVQVKDYGIGIAPEHHAQVFERFQRAVSGRQYSGLGLGLYIVKKIVESHQGRITLQSQLGKGSTFIVELPLQVQPQAQDPGIAS